VPEQGTVTIWLQELQAGRPSAATDLWHCYYERLVRLAAQKLRSAPRRMADEEDAVVAAFNSFYRGVQQGRFPKLEDRDDLWQVLVMLTARKAANQAKHATRQKRGDGQVRGESVFIKANDENAGIHEIVGTEPTPDFAHEVSEQCARLLAVLDDDTLRAVAVAKMEGYSNDEIAAKMEVKTRTIERKLKTIRELWSAADFS
jgi:DNA-directed RNA polymerase specialized sigma24 family protein